jgi:hypothetical protein
MAQTVAEAARNVERMGQLAARDCRRVAAVYGELAAYCARMATEYDDVGESLLAEAWAAAGHRLVETLDAIDKRALYADRIATEGAFQANDTETTDSREA